LLRVFGITREKVDKGEQRNGEKGGISTWVKIKGNETGNHSTSQYASIRTEEGAKKERDLFNRVSFTKTDVSEGYEPE
jgi:hypothetical protein